MARSIYFPEESICVHMSRVRRSPTGFTAGYYYYGENRQSSGPYAARWAEDILRHGDLAESSRYQLRSSKRDSEDTRGELSGEGGDVEE